MRVLPTFISFCLLTIFTFQSQAYGYVKSTKNTGYLEVGFGATQFDFVDKVLTDYEIAPSPNLKFLLGGRVGRSQHTWFEFGYAYNGALKTEDNTAANDIVTTYRSQSISMGLKFTTAPNKPVSAFVRAGGGRLMKEVREEVFASSSSIQLSNIYETSLTNHLYGGAGINFALGRNARLGVEAQQMQYTFENTTFSDMSLMMTFTRYIK